MGGQGIAGVHNLCADGTGVATVGREVLALQVVPGRVLVPQLLTAQRTGVPS